MTELNNGVLSAIMKQLQAEDSDFDARVKNAERTGNGPVQIVERFKSEILAYFAKLQPSNKVAAKAKPAVKKVVTPKTGGIITKV